MLPRPISISRWTAAATGPWSWLVGVSSRMIAVTGATRHAGLNAVATASGATPTASATPRPTIPACGTVRQTATPQTAPPREPTSRSMVALSEPPTLDCMTITAVSTAQ